MLGLLLKFFREQRALAALEFALCAPILLLGLIGTYDTSLVINANWKAASAAQDLADLIAQQTNGVTDMSCSGSNGCGSLQNFCNAAQEILTPFPTGAASGQSGSFSASIVSVTNTNGNVAVDWESDSACTATGQTLGAFAKTYATAPISGGISPPCAGGGAANLVSCSGDSVIVVQVSYVLKLAIPLPSIFPSSNGVYTLQSITYARPRSGTSIAYST